MSTFAQSILQGPLTPWFSIKKSTRGLGFMIIVVDTSALNINKTREKHFDKDGM